MCTNSVPSDKISRRNLIEWDFLLATAPRNDFTALPAQLEVERSASLRPYGPRQSTRFFLATADRCLYLRWEHFKCHPFIEIGVFIFVS